MAEMFLAGAARHGERVLYRFARGGAWEAMTWRAAAESAREIGLGLLALAGRPARAGT